MKTTRTKKPKAIPELVALLKWIEKGDPLDIRIQFAETVRALDPVLSGEARFLRFVKKSDEANGV